LLHAMQQALSIEHGDAEISNSKFFGVHIAHAYVITCRRGSGTTRMAPSSRKAS
jgi:hypothetical protein